MIRKSLRNGLEIFRQSVPLFAFLSICYIVLELIGQLFVKNMMSSPAFFPFCAVAFQLALFLRAGMFGYVYKKIKHENSSLSTFFSLGCKYFFSQLFFYTALLFMLLITVATSLTAFFWGTHLVCWAMDFRLTEITGITLLIAAFCLTAILGACLILRLFFASTIIVVDNLKAVPAIKKSWEITRSFFGKTCIFAAIYLAIIAIPRLFNRFEFNDFEAIQILLITGTSLFTVFAEIYFTAACMSIYLEFAKESR